MDLILNQEVPGVCDCGTIFRREFISRSIDPRHTNIRHVSAYCDGCDKAFCVDQELRNGIWCDRPPGVQVLTDGRRLAAIKARVAKVRGDVVLSTNGH